MRILTALPALLTRSAGGCGDRPALQLRMKPGASTGVEVRGAMGQLDNDGKMISTSRRTSIEAKAPAGRFE